MKWIPVFLILMAATSAFSASYTGKIVEVSRSPEGCVDYSTITLQQDNGGTAKFRVHKTQESFKEILAMSLSGMTSGLNATAEYVSDSNNCGTYYYLHGLTVRNQ